MLMADLRTPNIATHTRVPNYFIKIGIEVPEVLNNDESVYWVTPGDS